jgi:hypothetical protein
MGITAAFPSHQRSPKMWHSCERRQDTEARLYVQNLVYYVSYNITSHTAKHQCFMQSSPPAMTHTNTLLHKCKPAFPLVGASRAALLTSVVHCQEKALVC